MYLNGMTENLNPGVGKYNIDKEIGSNKSKYTI